LPSSGDDNDVDDGVNPRPRGDLQYFSATRNNNAIADFLSRYPSFHFGSRFGQVGDNNDLIELPRNYLFTVLSYLDDASLDHSPALVNLLARRFRVVAAPFLRAPMLMSLLPRGVEAYVGRRIWGLGHTRSQGVAAPLRTIFALSDSSHTGIGGVVAGAYPDDNLCWSLDLGTVDTTNQSTNVVRDCVCDSLGC